MINNLASLYSESIEHKQKHGCGGIPYDHADLLGFFIAVIKPKSILEVGTALGYTAACMALANPYTQIDTIDQDDSHLIIAKKKWEELHINNRINALYGKAEGILRELDKEYDVIFFDGYVPQTKMLVEFERLLKREGILITANLFLRDKTGGKYLRRLSKTDKWQTIVFSDTAISRKLF